MKRIVVILAFLSFTVSAKTKNYCSKESDSFYQLGRNHKLWLEEILAGRTQIIPSITFDRDIELKSQKDAMGEYKLKSVAKTYIKKSCSLVVLIDSSSDLHKDLVIKKGTVLHYGDDIDVVKIDPIDRFLELSSKLKINITFMGLSEMSCTALDITNAAKELGFYISGTTPFKCTYLSVIEYSDRKSLKA